MNHIDPRYLAGVMDSDGSFTVTKRHCYRVNCNYTAMVQLTWTLGDKTLEFMERLVSQYGGSYFIGNGSSSSKFKNSNPVIKYCGTGKAAESIAKDVIPYLVLKTDQASNIIELRRIVSLFKGFRPENITNQLEKIYLANKAINSKNVLNKENILARKKRIMTNHFNLDAIIEIPFGSMFKYETDKRSGQLIIDRPLPFPLPYNYGYIPNTLHGDGDPLDVCIIGENPIYPLTKAKVMLVGAFKCIDNGDSDDKLVGYIAGSVLSEEQIEAGKEKIKHYLSSYKPGFEVKEFVGADVAYNIVMKDIDSYLHE